MNIFKLSTTLTSIIRPCTIRNARHASRASYAQTLLNLPETKVTVLENGFKVASEQSDNPAATVGLWVDAGSRFETPETNGLGHFFERMAFKGTAQKTRNELETEIEEMGAQFDSYADREETAFYARCSPKDVSQVVGILGDVVRNPRLDGHQIEETRSEILEELKEVESDQRLVTFDYLHLIGYQKTPLGQPVLGPSANIKKFSKEDLSHYIRNNYLAPRMVLVGTGDVNHDELVKVAEKHFGSVPINYTDEIPLIKYCRFTGSEVRDRDDWKPFAHVAIAVDTCGHGSPDIYPLMLAKQIVGSWDKTFGCGENTTNKVIHNIYKEPRCHSFDSFHITYRDTGLWGCYFVMDKMVLDDFIFNLQNEWMRICVGIGETDLKIAKNMLRTNLLEKFDNITATAADIGRQVLHYGERTSLEDVEEHIASIDINKLKDVASKYIYDRCPAVVGVGPIEGLTDYNRVRSNMSWAKV